jgi:predicted phage baseplate assembly protein
MTEYRWGGGAAGNAGANKITSLNSAVPYVSAVTNLAPSYGGSDEESLSDAKARAPMVIRTMTRGVTADDMAFLAEETPGANIRRAVAYPLLNPNYRIKRPAVGSVPAPEVPIPGVVTVIVVPDSTDPQPLPSSDTLNLVAQWLDQHRLLTAELYVAAPHYRQVHIRARVIAKPSADSGVVQQQLLAGLLRYFHPLTGGADGQGWSFGGTIDFSGTYRQILSNAGVARIDTSSVETFVDDQLVPPCTDFPLEPDELVYSLDHEIEVTYS